MSGRAATFDLPELIDAIIKTSDLRARTHTHTDIWLQFYFPLFFVFCFDFSSRLTFFYYSAHLTVGRYKVYSIVKVSLSFLL